MVLSSCEARVSLRPKPVPNDSILAQEGAEGAEIKLEEKTSSALLRALL